MGRFGVQLYALRTCPDLTVLFYQFPFGVFGVDGSTKLGPVPAVVELLRNFSNSTWSSKESLVSA